ncbi:chemotaxis protein CheW [Roseofilum sp. BLCC_M91]|uniref:Chemotaxis protein CheW n=1 Tax=Roseofilum halophilum BLCC-M91 TaxID=3022259 RepID=A0ABT7BKJ5_9CYAN|nr:chemotaxis protein CheW [Roseofilum halophilum]MDJ1179711.1 chemotaxis protein CheW [Roseofilum halophilum BLCC-M91]
MINASPAHPQTPEITLPFILFELAGTTYGIVSHQVQQIEMVDQITPVPNAAPFVEGVVFCRSQVIPAINLRIRLGFERQPYDLLTRLIVIHTQSSSSQSDPKQPAHPTEKITEGDRARDGSHYRRVGLIVDSAREFIAIGQDLIQPPPEGLSGVNSQYLSGIITLDQRVILILDIEKIIET